MQVRKPRPNGVVYMGMKFVRPKNHVRLIMTGTDIYPEDLRELIRLAGRAGLEVNVLQARSDSPGTNIVEHVMAALNADPEVNRGHKASSFTELTRRFGDLSLENLAVLSFQDFLDLRTRGMGDETLLIESHVLGLMMKSGVHFTNFDPRDLLKTPLIRNRGPYSNRLTNTLIDGGLRWFEQLAFMTSFEVQGIRNLGGKYFAEAESALLEHKPPLQFLGQ